MARVDEVQFSEAIGDVLFAATEYAEPLTGATIRTFEEAGLLTRNSGFVIRLSTGEEFQLTIKQSR